MIDIRQTELKQILEAMPTFAGIFNLKGECLLANDFSYGIIPGGREELVGRHFADTSLYAHSEEARREVREGLDRAIRGEAVTCCLHPAAKDGSILTVKVALRPLRNEAGEVVFVMAGGVDLTEWKEAEQKVADAQRFTEAIFTASPLGILTYSADGQCVSANASAARLIGTSIERLQAENFREISIWEAIGFRAAAEETLASGKEKLLTAHFTTLYGKEAWLGASFARFNYGEKQHLIVVLADIAEQKKTEQELVATNERFARQEAALISLTRGAMIERQSVRDALRKIVETGAAVLQVGRAGVWKLGDGGKSATCEALYQAGEQRYSEGTVLSNLVYPAYFQAIVQDDVIAASDAMRDPRTAEFATGYFDSLGIGAVIDAPIKLHGRTVGVLSFEHTGGPRHWTADEQTFAIAVSNLVAMIFLEEERKTLESRVLRAQRMESIGTLASGVAHDLNNILSPILMSVQVLRRPLSPEKLEKIVSTIETSADRGAQVVKQVLAFGRGLSGEKHPLDVSSLIRDIAKIMQETFPKHLEIDVPTARGLWPVSADATHLHQVLLNLCVNARDAMPSGGVLRITAGNLLMDENCASMIPGTKAGPYVVIKVSDTGTGIPPGVLEHIFDPFFTTKSLGNGTGLGLSTVHGIVTDHGGVIDVSTEVGRGTTFTVYLPGLPEHEIKEVGTSASAAPRGAGELVLVVDDEPGIISAVGRALTTFGYRAICANDGAEALAHLARHLDEVAVLLTDVMMPLMDGPTLIRTARRIKPGLLVIAMTGLGEENRLADLKSLGVDPILHKPFQASALLHALHRALHPQQSSA